MGYLGLKEYLENHPDKYGIFLETAHPSKILRTVEETLGTKVELPQRIQDLLEKEKQSTPISNYEDLKRFLLA